MQHLREKIQFPCFQFRKVLQKWKNIASFDCLLCFLINISTKYYENPTMLSRVIAKNISDVFLRHSHGLPNTILV